MAMIGICLTSAASARALLALEENNKPKNKKREWIKDWKRRRECKSSFKLLHEELRLDDKDAFRRYLRMDEDTFKFILDLVSPQLKRQNTFMRDSIPVDEKLCAVLRFLATGESYRSIEYHTRLSLSLLSELIPEVCAIIYEKLKQEYLAVIITLKIIYGYLLKIGSFSVSQKLTRLEENK